MVHTRPLDIWKQQMCKTDEAAAWVFRAARPPQAKGGRAGRPAGLSDLERANVSDMFVVLDVCIVWCGAPNGQTTQESDQGGACHLVPPFSGEALAIDIESNSAFGRKHQRFGDAKSPALKSLRIGVSSRSQMGVPFSLDFAKRFLFHVALLALRHLLQSVQIVFRMSMGAPPPFKTVAASLAAWHLARGMRCVSVQAAGTWRKHFDRLKCAAWLPPWGFTSFRDQDEANSSSEIRGWSVWPPSVCLPVVGRPAGHRAVSGD